jgi:hypothetical protein
MRGTLSALAAILTTSVASAAPARKAGDTHQPPVALDPTPVVVQLSIQGGDSGYTAQVEFIMKGASSATDRVRFEWKQNGKVLATGKCGGRYNPKFTSLSGKCETDATLTAKGAIEIDIVYTDDQTDTDYLVTKLAVDVRRWQSIGKSIDYVGSLLLGGWAEIRRSNREKVLRGRRELCAVLEIDPPAPDSMIGSLASVPLPDSKLPLDWEWPYFEPLQDRLFKRHQIEVPVMPWPQAPKPRRSTRSVRSSAVQNRRRSI